MTSAPNITTRVNRGLAWTALASPVVWTLDIVGTLLVLALWISPEQMGVAALAIPFFPALDLASEMGLGAAVIQRDDHTEDRLSTVFWVNVAISVVLALVLALGVGPLLAWIHGHAILATLFAAYGVKLIWHNLFLVPRALMRRQLRFKELELLRALSNVGEFVGKVGAAAAGLGVWCFVIGPMCRVLVTGIGIQLCLPWRPRLVCKLRDAMDWVTFGLKAASSQIIYHIYTNVDYQVVGYMFSERATGLYWFAYELVLKPCFLIGQTLHAIAFAAYSRLKLDRPRLIEQFIGFSRLSLVVMLGFLSLIAVSADDILALVWGSEAMPAAAVARILCLVGVLRALSFVIPPLLDGVGRPGASLIYNALAAVLVPLSFVVCAALWGDTLGYVSVAVAWTIGYPLAFAVLVALALAILELSPLAYLARLWGVVACAAAAAGAGWVARALVDGASTGTRFGVAAAATVTVYAAGLAVTQGLTPRSVAAAIRGDAPRATPDRADTSR